MFHRDTERNLLLILHVNCKLTTQYWAGKAEHRTENIGMTDGTIKALLMSVTWLDVTIVIQLKFILLSFVFITNDQTIIGLPSLLVVCLYSYLMHILSVEQLKQLNQFHTDILIDYTLWLLWKIPTAVVEDITVYCVTI